MPTDSFKKLNKQRQKDLIILEKLKTKDKDQLTQDEKIL